MDIIEELKKINASQQAQIEELIRQNQILTEQVKYLRNKLYGHSSEKKRLTMAKPLYLTTPVMVFSKNQSQLENKSKLSQFVKRKGKVKKRKSRKTSR
ncbi:hypothetical protein [Lentilactobacillus rapi]|uniref:hypothetical protein n=1 Tax=Lentilactobacillus rapi TaxID=481723 RepID=UPI0006CFCDC1|nr:hypothetical protein [Lentilactobacillus rapi]